MVRKSKTTNGNFNMALLDFMKQGTQWLTDNTGMDWNTVQRDPGLAAKRLMGGEVSPYQAQPTQANLLDVATPEKIVADPALQNRMTYNSPQSDAEFFPDYRTVQNTSSLDDLYGNNNGWDRNRKEAQVLDYSNRETYQNLPQKKEDYQAGLLAEDKLYGDYPMLGFTEIAPGLRASEPIKGGQESHVLADQIKEKNDNAAADKAVTDGIKRDLIKEQNVPGLMISKDRSLDTAYNKFPNTTPNTTPKETSWLDSLMWGDDSNGAALMEYFRDGGDRESVVNFDQSYNTNEFNSNDGSSGNSGDQGIFDTVVNFGRGVFTDEGKASESTDPVLANTAPKERDAYLKLRQDEKTAIQIDALDVPDARKIELYNQKGIPVPDKYGMKGLISKK